MTKPNHSEAVGRITSIHESNGDEIFYKEKSQLVTRFIISVTGVIGFYLTWSFLIK